jgi:HSP20 family protein
MAIVRWEPFRDLVATQDQLNRLFNETFSRFLGGSDSGSRAWAPPVDIRETDHNVILTAELPGVNPNEVEVRVEGNTLYLKGERKLEDNEQNYRQIERTYGPFSRAFSLPASVDPNNVNAEYKNGLLTLTLTKREEVKPKTIKIQVAGGETARAIGTAAKSQS